jgi:hypothetical protein
MPARKSMKSQEKKHSKSDFARMKSEWIFLIVACAVQNSTSLMIERGLKLCYAAKNLMIERGLKHKYLTKIHFSLFLLLVHLLHFFLLDKKNVISGLLWLRQNNHQTTNLFVLLLLRIIV